MAIPLKYDDVNVTNLYHPEKGILYVSNTRRLVAGYYVV
jgi:hypothetical protein